MTYGGAGSGLHMTQVEVDLGYPARLSGSFTIPGTGLDVNNTVRISQAAMSYTGKGTRRDESEMDQISVNGMVTATTAITCYWVATGMVCGKFKFSYTISH